MSICRAQGGRGLLPDPPRARPFIGALVEFMISGPVMVQALEGGNAVLKHRDLMGATDPKKAEPEPSAPASPTRSTRRCRAQQSDAVGRQKLKLRTSSRKPDSAALGFEPLASRVP